ncbi:hypothetical protein LINPERHAP2_LOCUS36911 [Linum perenne]
MQDDEAENPRCPKIRFTEKEIAEFYKPWSKALVVKVLERSFVYPMLKRRLEFLWAREGHIQVSDLSNDFFLVRFSNDDDYNRAAFKGPWKLSVTRIGNHIGRTVRLDLATMEGARARYARVCVEIDLSKPLLGKYMIGDREFHVEYECLGNICYTCGMYGHSLDSCLPSKEPVEESEPRVTTTPPETDPEPEAETGSWMTVQRRGRSKANKKQPPAKSEEKNPKGPTSAADAGTGSRFTFLRRDKVPIEVPDTSNSVKHKPSSQPNHDQEGNSILSMVELTNKIFSQPGTKDAGQQGIPLQNITNKAIGSGKVKPGEPIKTNLGPENLFSVPISFVNPMFE